VIPVVPRLFVTWQEPESRRIYPIARLLRLPSGEYELAYIRAVAQARAQGFGGLPGFEDLEQVYVSLELPALFERRPPKRRPRAAPKQVDAPAAPAAPELSAESLDAAPIILRVPGASGETSWRLEVFAPPLPATAGRFWGAFVARGVGRAPGSADAVEQLAPEEPLTLVAEPENAYNPRAVLIARADQTPIGYLPDYLANELGEAGSGPEQLEVQVQRSERVTFPPAPAIYQVTCRYTCPAPLGRALFRSEPYQPASPRAFSA
jgi:hypothetical protein